MAFTAPTGGDSKKVDNVAIIPQGEHLCTFYGLSSLGEQDGGKFGAKQQCNLAFEFPREKRVFYEGDPEKPCAVFAFETLSMAPKSNLKTRYVDPMMGRTVTEEEAKTFDIATLLGLSFVATIIHSQDGKYANISSIRPLTEQNMLMFGLQSVDQVEQINERYYFEMEQGFNSENFKTLPKFIREKIKDSTEGKRHAMSGGTFAEPDKSDFNNGNNPATASAGKRLVMNPNAKFTYEQYMGADWTDQMLVDNGEATWQAPVAPPAPHPAPAAPQAPQAPQPQQPAAPQAPTPAQPQAPQQPTAPAPTPTPPQPAAPQKDVLVMNDPTQDIEAWRKGGWTDELIVSQGHGKWVKQ